MSFLYGEFLGGFRALGLLLVRAVTGVAFILHGLQKLEKGAFVWMGQDSEIPGILQAGAAVAEVAGGGLLIAGLLTPLACLMLAGVMVGALTIYHLPQGHPFVNPAGASFELAAVYLAISVMLLLTGPGALSADAVLFKKRSDTART